MNRKYLIPICSIIAAFSLNVNAQHNLALPFKGKPAAFAKPVNVSIPWKSQLKGAAAEQMPVYSIDNYYYYTSDGMLSDSSINNRTDLFFTGNSQDSIIVYNYDSDTKKYSPSHKTTYKRDVMLRDTLSYTYIYNAGWRPSKQIHTGYDEKGNVTLDKEYSWNVSSKIWEGTKYVENAFDVKGNTILYAEYDWNIASEKWIGTKKHEDFNNYNKPSVKFVYNFRDSSLEYNWDSVDSKWYISSKEKHYYTSKGQDSLTLTESRINADSLFHNESSSYSLYDINGNDSVVYLSRLLKPGWFVKDIHRVLYSYEDDSILNGTSQEWISQERDTLKNLWVDNTMKWKTTIDKNSQNTIFAIMYSYNLNDNKWMALTKTHTLWVDSIRKSLVANYSWDYVNEILVNSDSTLFYYNGSGQLTKTVQYIGASNTKGFQKHEFEYNTNGQLTLTNISKWETDSWVNNSRELVTYNLSGTEIYHENADWNATSASWLPNEIIRYYYTSYNDPNGINTAISDRKFRIFPNPTAGMITFDMPPNTNSTRVEVYSSTGVLIQSKNVSSSSTIDLSDLNNGLYFIKAKGSDNTIPLLLQK